MKSIIKWPGGKTNEIKTILPFIPQFKRYIEPFLGGGALFFHLEPKNAIINDISHNLIQFYQLVKNQDTELHEILLLYAQSFESLLKSTELYTQEFIEEYPYSCDKELKKIVLKILKASFIPSYLFQDSQKYEQLVIKTLKSKLKKITLLNLKENDLKKNFQTAFMTAFYLYQRKLYNQISCTENHTYSLAYKIANFYFIREFCYGSMFRYNKKGEFNIPYGGISYNNTNFYKKINSLFNPKIKELLSNTCIYSQDFEDFLKRITLSSDDFIFLDPPYDSDFSDYEGRGFTKEDHKRLAYFLSTTKAFFVLVIKNTDFIMDLYRQFPKFSIIDFNKYYNCNLKSRNQRHAQHLIITNVKKIKFNA